MVAVPVSKDVLQWARNARGLSLEEAAKRLKWDVAKLSGFEGGATVPTLGELETIAQRYQIALAALLMPAPLPIPPYSKLNDFRAFGGTPLPLGFETLVAIEEVNERIEGICNLRDVEPFMFEELTIPLYRLSDDPERVASDERRRLGVTVSQQLGWPSLREAFLRWRELIEAQGVFVYQLNLAEDDTRGFSVWDERQVPVIVIDAREGSYGAKIFTLLHEYAHVLLRIGGIGNQSAANNIEAFCNKFAAFFLMPRDRFLAESREVGRPPWIELHVTKLANKFKVSKSAVALHMETVNLARSGFYQKMLALWSKRTPPRGGGRASYAEQQANRLGSRHVSLVLRAVDAGTVNKLDAFEMLSVKPQFFDDLRSEVTARQTTYGVTG